MASPTNDPNVALLAQLQSAADSARMLPNDQVMAFLAAEPEPDPLAGVKYTGDLEADARPALSRAAAATADDSHASVACEDRMACGDQRNAIGIGCRVRKVGMPSRRLAYQAMNGSDGRPRPSARPLRTDPASRSGC